MAWLGELGEIEPLRTLGLKFICIHIVTMCFRDLHLVSWCALCELLTD